MKINKHTINQRVADSAEAGLSVEPVFAHKPSTLTEAIRRAIHSYQFALPIFAFALPSMAYANPEGGQVVAGSATITSPDANTTLITQSTTSAAINWQRFNIGTHEYVQFAQPDSTSVALNRVIGGDPSQILGNLSANGQVFLVNPNGVYFGQGATVDVGGIVASVLDIRTDDFMSGNYVFSKPDGAPSSAGVVNDGLITARDGGYVVMMGDYVQNNGIVSARMGTVALAVGKRITMDVKPAGLVSVAIEEATLSELAGVSNTGDITANGGRVIMSAKAANDLVDTAINNEGLVVANSITERNGVIFLTAEGGDIVNSGTLDASAEDGSNVDGGGVLVYSDKNIINGSGAVISATGDGSGDGGAVRVIAEEFMGHQSGARIDVTSEAGNGGFVELSGHGSLAIRGDVDIGSGGSLLIDPANLEIQNGNLPPFSTTGGGRVGKNFIQDQLNTGADVTLVASSSITAGSSATSGSSNFTITSTNPAGDLSIKIGTLSVGAGTLGGGSGPTTGGGTASFNCVADGFCFGGTTVVFTPDANGTIDLATVSFNLAGGLSVAGGTTSGTVGLGAINAGGNVSITGGNDVNVTGDISANNITLTADADGNGVGGVNITGVYGTPITVTAAGNMNVSGNSFNVVGATAPSFSSATDSKLTVQANNIDVALTGNMNVSGGVFPPTSAASNGNASVAVSVQATNDITISANSLTVKGGQADGSTQFGGNTLVVDASARLAAGRDVSLTLANSLMVQGGTANAEALDSSASVHVKADAAVTAGRDILINNVGTNLTVAGGTAYAAKGDGFSASCFSGCTVSANANASLAAAGNVVVTSIGNNLDVGGGLATANGSTFSMTYVGTFANVTANANADLSGSLITINSIGGSLSVAGGTASAYASHSFSTGATPVVETATANADANIFASQNIQITNVVGNLSVSGGIARAGATSDCSGTCTASASARAGLSAGQALSVTTIGGNLIVSGGTADAVAGLGATNANANAFASARVDAASDLTLNITGALDVSGGSAAADASGTDSAVASAKAEVSAGGNVSVTAGSVNINRGAAAIGTGGGLATATSDVFMTAGSALSVVASSNITGNNADISAAGMYMSAGNNINLQTSFLQVGSGTVAGISGDSLALAYLAANGITPPTTSNPNAKFSAGGTLNLGTVSMFGNVPYLWLEADTTSIQGVITEPGATDLLVQYSPFTVTNTIGVESDPDTSQLVNYNNLQHFSILPSTTIIVGSSSQTGEIFIGDLGDVNIGAKNILFVTSSEVTTIDNVISTGFVGELIVGQFNAEFVTPVLTEVEIDVEPVDEDEEKKKKKNLVKDDEEEINMCEAG